LEGDVKTIRRFLLSRLLPEYMASLAELSVLQLYNLMGLIRGPDPLGWNLKQVFSARARALVFLSELGAFDEICETRMYVSWGHVRALPREICTMLERVAPTSAIDHYLDHAALGMSAISMLPHLTEAERLEAEALAELALLLKEYLPGLPTRLEELKREVRAWYVKHIGR